MRIPAFVFAFALVVATVVSSASAAEDVHISNSTDHHLTVSFAVRFAPSITHELVAPHGRGTFRAPNGKWNADLDANVYAENDAYAKGHVLCRAHIAITNVTFHAAGYALHYAGGTCLIRKR